VTAQSGFDDLIDALRGAFVGSDGDPVEVKTHQLDDAQPRRLTDGDGEVTVTVTDYGTWKAPDATDTLRGRGHLLIGALADHVSTIQRDNGTTVTLTWTLPGTTE
jgi:hypothetical protein